MTTRRTFTADEINRLLNSLAGDDPYDLGGGLVAVRMAGSKISFKIERDGKGEHFLKDADTAELAEISAVLWERGKEFLPDDTVPDKTPKRWEEKDARFVCKDTACGRLCLRRDLCPENCDLLARGLATAAQKKRLDDLLMPDWMKEKSDPLEGTPAGLMPDYLRDPEPDSDLAARRAKMTPEERRVDELKPDWFLEIEKKERAEAALSLTDQLVPDNLRAIIKDPALAKRLHDGTATAQEKIEDLLSPESLKGE